MREKIAAIEKEVNKVILGKEDVIKKFLSVILAGGHILLEDIPGVGKTTLALAFNKALALNFNRVQFTPDVIPSDITVLVGGRLTMPWTRRAAAGAPAGAGAP